jgi:hypothetical protein
MTSKQKMLLRILLRFFGFFTFFTLTFILREGSLSSGSFRTVLLTSIGFVITAELFTILRVYLTTPQKAGK